MRQREKISALILSRRNFGEADRLLTLFTKEYGLLRVIAKGVRKIPSRRGGHIEPFTSIEAVISSSHDYYYLSSVDVVNLYADLHLDSEALLHARNLSMVVTGLFEEKEPQATIFESLKNAWQILPELNSKKRACLEVALAIHILQLAGVMPDLASCRLCGVTRPSKSIILDPREGNWHCFVCYGKTANGAVSLSPDLLKVLRFLSAYPAKALNLHLEKTDSREILLSLRLYIAEVIGQPALTRQW